jgi:hypothetical protein
MTCRIIGSRQGGGTFNSALGGMLLKAGLQAAVPFIASSIAGPAATAAFASSIGSVAGATGPYSSIVNQLAGSANPLTQLTSAASSFSSIGSAFDLGSGSITGVIGDGFQTFVGQTFADSMANHGSELFGTGINQFVQTLVSSEGFANVSQQVAEPLFNALNTGFGQAFSSLTQALPVDNIFDTSIQALGASIPDWTAMVTNGLTHFMPNIAIPGYAGDMINLGEAYDMIDITNFGNPGQIVQKILTQGGGAITGIEKVLDELKFDPSIIANLSDGKYNDILTNVFSEITNPEMIANAQVLLKSNIPDMNSLVDYLDLEKILPNSFKDIVPNTIEELRETFRSIDMGRISTPVQLGKLVRDVTTVDLNLIKNLTDVVDPDAAAAIELVYTGGTGPYGNITVTDLIGSVGGIDLKDPAALYVQAHKEMDELGVFDPFKTILAELQAGIAGTYTSGSGVYDTDVISDPSGITHETLDSFVAAKKGQLETEVANIASGASGASAESYAGAFGTAKSNYIAMQNKIRQEDIHQAKTDLHLEHRNESPDNAYYFMLGLVDRAADPATLALLQGMNDAEDDNSKYKEYMKAAIAEAQNITLYDEYGIIPRAAKVIEV